MKKLICLLLSLLLIMSMLSACSLFDPDDDNDKKDGSSGIADQDGEETTDEEENTDGAEGYIPGTLTDSSWSSESLGLQFIAPESMVMTTQEELEALMEISTDMYAGSYDEQVINYAKVNTIYEMMAMDLSGNNVIITAEKLPLSNMTTQQYVTALKTNMQNIGFDITFSDTYSSEICGTEYLAMDGVLSSSGATVQQFYFIRKVEDRMVSIAVTAVTEDALDTILDGFAAY